MEKLFPENLTFSDLRNVVVPFPMPFVPITGLTGANAMRRQAPKNVLRLFIVHLKPQSRLMDENDPERIVMGGELMKIATDYFGDNVVAVILGLGSKRAGARRLGINYEAFRKRLQRKLAKFRSILKGGGYDIN